MTTSWPTNLKLFLLPGLDGTGLLFEPLLNELPKECIAEVISYPVDQLLTFEQHIEYVMGKLPESEPFALLAESFSGPVAIEILNTNKFQIQMAIFVATFAKSPLPALLGLATHFPLARLLKLNFPDVIIRHFCLGQHASSKQIESFKKSIKHVSPEVLSQRLKILATVDSTDALTGINTQCYYLRALGDKLVPGSALIDFEKGIKDLEIISVKGPHLILQTEARKCAEAICNKAR